MVRLYQFALKRILQNKITTIILACILAICMYLTFAVMDNAQSKSSVPIGIVNLDDTNDAKELVEKMKNLEAFYVYEGEYDKVIHLLEQDRIQAVFLIKSGYESSIKAGKIKDLITLFYKENNKTVKVLSDIFASEMLQKICLYKGYLVYEEAFHSNADWSNKKSLKITLEEYEKYADKLMTQESYTNVLDIKIVDITSKTDIKRLDNSILYLQILAGIMAMFISFFAFYTNLPSVVDIEEGIRKRVKIVGRGARGLLSYDISFILAGMTLLSVFHLFVTLCFLDKIEGVRTSHGFILFLLLSLYGLVNVTGFTIIGLALKKVSKYQKYGIILGVCLGIIGLVSTFSGLINYNLLNLSKLTPNSWFISGFIDIILNTGLQDIPYKQIFSLGMTEFILLLILWVVDKVKPA